MFKAPNNIHQNWNKDLYIATKKEVILDDYGNEIVTYNEPFYFGKVNYQPLTRKDLEAYVKVYGETKNSIISLLIDYTEDGRFKAFDLAYLYGATKSAFITIFAPSIAASLYCVCSPSKFTSIVLSFTL